MLLREIKREVEKIKIRMILAKSPDLKQELFKRGYKLLIDNYGLIPYNDYFTLTKELSEILEDNPTHYLLFLNEMGFSLMPVKVENRPLRESNYFVVINDDELLFTSNEEKALKMKAIGNLVLSLYEVAERSSSGSCVFLGKLL